MAALTLDKLKAELEKLDLVGPNANRLRMGSVATRPENSCPR